MTQSFSATGPGALATWNTGQRRRVLVTGAAGNIGSYFAEHSRQKYDLLLMVRSEEEGTSLQAHGEVVVADLSDLERLKEICQGVDTVVHMAGDPDPAATWDSLLDANITGTYHIFVAAKAAGCRRVIHASSIHAVSGYPADVQVKTTDPVNPGDLYGVSKCFGEALARYMAEQEGLSAITLRIGAFQPLEKAREPEALSMLDAFLSRRDLNDLIERCIDVENVRFAIFNAVSNNVFKRLDISDARELLGWEPQDDLAAENARLKDLELSETVSAHARGGDEEQSGLRDDL